LACARSPVAGSERARTRARSSSARSRREAPHSAPSCTNRRTHIDGSVARPAPRVPGSLTAPNARVGARLAGRGRAQIIRSVAAPERRVVDRSRRPRRSFGALAANANELATVGQVLVTPTRPRLCLKHRRDRCDDRQPRSTLSPCRPRLHEQGQVYAEDVPSRASSLVQRAVLDDSGRLTRRWPSRQGLGPSAVPSL
jgi:hypothetical protein